MLRAIILIQAVATTSAFAGNSKPEYFAYAINPGGSGTRVTAINDSGQVVGALSTLSGREAFITGPKGLGVKPLGTLGGTNSSATAVNNIGQVAGVADSIAGSSAFITAENGENMRALEVPQPNFGTGVSSINATGQVVGLYVEQIKGSTKTTWFVTGPNGENLSSLTIPHGKISNIARINDFGQIAGTATFETELSPHAFVTGANGIGVVDLGDFGGLSSYAQDLNNSGAVSGYFNGLNGNTVPFSTGQNGKNPRVRATLGGDQGMAYAIDPSGKIAGESTLTGNDHTARAFVALAKGKSYDLNKLVQNLPAGILLTRVVDANAAGQLLTIADDNNGYIVCPKLNCE